MAEQPSAPEELAAPQKNRTKLLIIFVLAALLAIGLSAAGAWFFLTGDSAEDGGAEPAAVASKNEQAGQGKQRAVYELLGQPFVVNFRGAGRERYLQVSMALMGRNEADLKALKAHMPTLRNQLVMLLSGQDFEDLRSPMGVEVLKQKATAEVQELAMREVGNTVVEQVLFTNFVMQ